MFIIFSSEICSFNNRETNQLVLFATLYFSEFFVKYEKIIKGDKLVFNEKELEKIVRNMLSDYI